MLRGVYDGILSSPSKPNREGEVEEKISIIVLKDK